MDSIGSLLKKIDKPEENHLHCEFQVYTMNIVKNLGISKKRKSAYFFAVKTEPSYLIDKAYSFAIDYPRPEMRDKIFFWKLAELKKNETAKH
jgi:hypothetical protein